MSLLLLGGTGEARQMATRLHDAGVPVIYSVAGLVRVPVLDCPVISGGFSQFGGLAQYLSQQGITSILDMTHPYAARISAAAVQASQASGVPLWRYERPPWQPQPEDDWRVFADWPALLEAIAEHRAVLFTNGQLSQPQLDQLAQWPHQQLWLRTAVQPKQRLPAQMQWLHDIGPFSVGQEAALLAQHGIDALVSKNSGGAATAAKLEAARQAGIPVYLLARPDTPPTQPVFDCVEACYDYVMKQYKDDLSLRKRS